MYAGLNIVVVCPNQKSQYTNVDERTLYLLFYYSSQPVTEQTGDEMYRRPGKSKEPVG